MQFFNRTRELTAFEDRWTAQGAQFALLYGRRRVGKTYLLQHFLMGKPHCYFLASQTTLSDNLSQLAESVLASVPGSGYRPEDMTTLNAILRFIGSVAREQRFVLVLDEFQYLLEQDPGIASRIQAWWDTDGIRSGVFLVLCGSHLGVMERLGGLQAPLFGRFTFRYKLPPMGYLDIAKFYDGSEYSIKDKLTAYGVLGGTPRYHALISPQRSLRDEICSHILNPLGLLHNEPEVLLLSSQVRDPAPYNSALRAIARGNTRFNEIAQDVGASSSQLSFYLRGLTEMDWIRREYPFGETSDRRAIYRASDNFLLFWYRFVAPGRSEMEIKDPGEVYERRIEPYLNYYMGRLVFEGICHQWLRLKGTQVLGDGITGSGRYWSRDGSLEIDVVAELDGGNYLIGECKWSSSPVGPAVLYELCEKIARMPNAKYHLNPRLVLFSLAGFDPEVHRRAQQENVLLVSGDELLS
jgi:hypothetical protein